MEKVFEILGMFFVSIGAIFLLLGALGILRMPDIYARLQAGTKASTLGTIGMLLGVGFLQPEWMLKVVVIIIFIILSNPISSHAIARGSCRSGILPNVNDSNSEKISKGICTTSEEQKEEINKKED